MQSGRAFRQPRGRARTPEDVRELVFAQGCLQIHDRNKREEDNEHDQCNGQDALPGPSAELEALLKRFVMIQTDGSLLENLEGRQNNSRYR